MSRILISQRLVMTFKYRLIKQVTFSIFSFQRTVSSVPPTLVGVSVAFDGYTIAHLFKVLRMALLCGL